VPTRVRSKAVVRDYAEPARLGGVSRARITQIINLLNLAREIQVGSVEIENEDATVFADDLEGLAGIRALAEKVEIRRRIIVVWNPFAGGLPGDSKGSMSKGGWGRWDVDNGFPEAIEAKE